MKSLRLLTQSVAVFVLCAVLSSCAMFGKSAEKLEPQARPYIYEEQYIEVNGAKMCYVEHGEGVPLIFIHGLMGGVYTWQDNLPGLSKKYKVVAVDLPGFCKSEKGNFPYTIPFFKEALRQFIEKKGYQRPVIIGISLGGHLAISYAIDHPEELGGIIVVGSTGGGRRFNLYEKLLVKLFWHDFVVSHVISGESLKRIWDRQFLTVNERTNQMFNDQPHFHDHSQAHKEYVHTFSRTLFSILHDPLKSRYHEIEVPCLIVWGKKDYYHHIEDAYEMNRLIPNSQLKIFEKAGHTLMQEDIEGFNDAVDSFVSGARKTQSL
jgi:pimeloyl-ACP methyl ester carboxylesterase